MMSQDPGTAVDINNDKIGGETVVIDHDDVRDYSSTQMLPESPEVVQKIRDWLKPTSYNIAGSEYRKHLASHVAGTGAWLTTSATYREWLQSNKGLLWIKGIPGSGKSVIAANLVNEIPETNLNCPVLFFFFRQIIEANHIPQALLRDWLDQLLSYSPTLQQHLKPRVHGSAENESMDNLWSYLRLGLSTLPGKAFCVADALDEMDSGNEAFIQELASLGQWQPEKVKVLITSRPVPNVERPLRNTLLLDIRLQENLVEADISNFVRFSLSNSKIPQSYWETISESVLRRAGGLFLYAKLVMDAFLEPGAEVDQVLRKVPTNMNDLYTKLLKEHTNRTRIPEHLQLLILQAATHAARPLRLLEFAELIKATVPEDVPPDLGMVKALIRTACGPLLEVLPNEAVSVVHHSLTEYLNGTTRSREDDFGYPILEPGSTHARLAVVCLQYLKSGCLDSIILKTTEDYLTEERMMHRPRRRLRPVNDMSRLRLDFPFYEYAAKNWHYHARRSEAAGHDQTEVNMHIMGLGENERRWRAWAQSSTPWNTNPTLLHIAAGKGLLSCVQEILKTVKDPDVLDNRKETPLSGAAAAGHVEVVIALIKAGANPDHSECDDGLRPLHRATRCNHIAMIRALLEAGVDPMTSKLRSNLNTGCMPIPSGDIGDTPLKYACEGGNLETVETFLPYMTNLEHLNHGLHWAAQKGKSDIVSRILEHPGVDINFKVRGQTALYSACAQQRIETVTVLLEAGASTNSERNNEMMATGTPSCIHALCNFVARRVNDTRHRDIGFSAYIQSLKKTLSLLIEAGADVRQATLEGETALHIAIKHQPLLIPLLLDAGADPNAQNMVGETPLHRAVAKGHGGGSAETMRLLVERGADINLTNRNGESPLLKLLSESGCHASLEGFMKHKPNCDIYNSNGDGPIALAIHNLPAKNLATQLKVILEGGANPNTKNRHGISPLLCLVMRESLSEETLGLLLQAGADINTRDNDGKTLLFRLLPQYLSVWNPDDMLQLIINRGASITTRDFRGRTVLHKSIRILASDRMNASLGEFKHHWSRFDHLRDLGADPKATDNHGNTLLHELAMCEASLYPLKNSALFWQPLADMGLSVNQKNNDGVTPLHMLCAENPRIAHRRMLSDDGYEMKHFVLSKCDDINVPDNDGITPLHIAVAVGEPFMKLLLDAGADPRLATLEGLTPLHIAARCRQPNIMGMLIEAIKSKWNSDADVDMTCPELVAAVNAKAFGKFEHITPLFYGCRSGRPETVALLLEAGAEFDCQNVLKACSEFEDEDALWSRQYQQVGNREPRQLAPLRLGDLCRPVRSSPPPTGVDWANETARIDEMVELLVKHGRGDGKLVKSMTEAIYDCRRRRQDYTASCLIEARNRIIHGDSRDEWHTTSGSLSHNLYQPLREASIRTLEESGLVKPGDSNSSLFYGFLFRKEYYLIEVLARKGGSFLFQSQEWKPTIFSLMIQYGLAFLVEKTGDIEINLKIDNRGSETRWCGDKVDSMPGLDPMSFLIDALKSPLPNMDMVRLLVKKFGFNTEESKFFNAPLPTVCSGELWWQSYQALPYLLKAGANIETRNSEGKTPLHVAITRGGQFRHQVIKTLLRAGADATAVDYAGGNCLSHAGDDVKLIKMLLSHGAIVMSDCVFQAIERGRIEVLRILLSAGADLGRMERKSNFSGSSRMTRGVMNETPLYYAGLKARLHLATGYEMEYQEVLPKVEIVQLLLDHGDEPFKKLFRSLKMKNQKSRHANEEEEYIMQTPSTNLPEGYEELTVLHELMAFGSIVDIFLRLPGLDVNHRDAKGRTLLLAACEAFRGPDCRFWTPVPRKRSQEGCTIFQQLVDLGANLEARDNNGRNVLHYMIGLQPNGDTCKGFGTFQKAMAYTVSKAPSLINQEDNQGRTPLYYAATIAAQEKESEAAARYLLDWGADPLSITKDGNTILHVLAGYLGNEGTRKLFRDVVDRGVDVNMRNAHGETLLFRFAERPEKDDLYGLDPALEDDVPTEVEATQMLQELDADFFVRDNKGRGLLHVAARGKVGRFKALLDIGLDPGLEDDSHQTPIDIATVYGKKKILKLFERKL